MSLLLTRVTADWLMQAAVGTPCGKKSQCAAQECCQILNDVFVASKRRQLDVPTGGAGNVFSFVLIIIASDRVK